MISIQEMRYRQRLKKYQLYPNYKSHAISFNYDYLGVSRNKPSLENLLDLKNEEKLDEISYITKLMDWVHSHIPHDGNSDIEDVANFNSIYAYTDQKNKGVNCKNIAIAMRDVLMLAGFFARYVICMPHEADFEECHAVNIVFLKHSSKWIFLDPTMRTFLMDQNNALLSIEEVREALCSGEILTTCKEMSWNGRSFEAEEYIAYMAKNMFRFASPLTSKWEDNDEESSTFVHLVPHNYCTRDSCTELHKLISNGSDRFYFTSDASFFWAKPNARMVQL